VPSLMTTMLDDDDDDGDTDRTILHHTSACVCYLLIKTLRVRSCTTSQLCLVLATRALSCSALSRNALRSVFVRCGLRQPANSDHRPHEQDVCVPEGQKSWMKECVTQQRNHGTTLLRHLYSTPSMFA